jgi:hypothetical protein
LAARPTAKNLLVLRDLRKRAISIANSELSGKSDLSLKTSNQCTLQRDDGVRKNLNADESASEQEISSFLAVSDTCAIWTVHFATACGWLL